MYCMHLLLLLILVMSSLCDIDENFYSSVKMSNTALYDTSLNMCSSERCSTINTSDEQLM